MILTRIPLLRETLLLQMRLHPKLSKKGVVGTTLLYPGLQNFLPYGNALLPSLARHTCSPAGFPVEGGLLRQ